MSDLHIRLEQNKLEKAAYLLKCVAHPIRISIIDLLDQSGSLNVSELQDALRIEQSLLSHHLTNMRDKGLLKTRREGKNVFYSLADVTVTMIIGCINSCKAV